MPNSITPTCLSTSWTPLAGSSVTDVHIVGRRGPAQATFTTKELKELGELDDTDVRIKAEDLVLDDASAAAVAENKAVARNVDVMEQWAQREPAERTRRIHLHFFARPDKVQGDSRVTGVVVERTTLDEKGAAAGTGEFETLPADLVIRSVGYRGQALDAVAFDAARGVIPNADGRVLHDGEVVVGEYVAGWIKRGPTGIIGTNKKDAVQTVAVLLEDLDTLPVASEGGQIDEHLASRGVDAVELHGWAAIDAAEVELGQAKGRERTTIHGRAEMIEIARAAVRKNAQK